MAAAVATGAAVATAGAIGFVGLGRARMPCACSGCVPPFSCCPPAPSAAALSSSSVDAAARTVVAPVQLTGRRARRRDRRAGVHRHAAASAGDEAGRMSRPLRSIGIDGRRSRGRRPAAERRRRCRRGRDLFGALDASHRQRPALGRDRTQRRRQVVAARGDRRRLSARRRSRCASTVARWPHGRPMPPRRAPRLEPAVLVGPVSARRCAGDRGPGRATAAPGGILPAHTRATPSPSTDCCWRLDLDRLADIDVRALSGGERQRVAIATALLRRTRRCFCSTGQRRTSTRRTSASCSRLLADHAPPGRRRARQPARPQPRLGSRRPLHRPRRQGRRRRRAARRSVLTAERMTPRVRGGDRERRSCTGARRFVGREEEAGRWLGRLGATGGIALVRVLGVRAAAGCARDRRCRRRPSSPSTTPAASCASSERRRASSRSRPA